MTSMSGRDSMGIGADSRITSGRIVVDKGMEPEDWQGIYDRLNVKANAATMLAMHFVVGVATLASLFGAVAVFGYGVMTVFSDLSIYYLACLVVPPSFLLAAAAGHASGNAFLRLRLGLDEDTRRGFANRLTLSRSPASWPAAVRRWLFTGDWMSSPVCDVRLPYVRIFVVGDQPESCREEDALWREILGMLSCDGRGEAGVNHREISYPPELPNWARNLSGAGAGFAELKNRIGEATAEEWVDHLWSRARRQWSGIKSAHMDESFDRECFEIHSLMLGHDRQALVVVFRPAGYASSGEAESAEPHADELAA